MRSSHAICATVALVLLLAVIGCAPQTRTSAAPKAEPSVTTAPSALPSPTSVEATDIAGNIRSGGSRPSFTPAAGPAPAATDAAPGAVGGALGGEGGEAQSTITPRSPASPSTAWPTFRSDAYKFTLRYPPSLVTVEMEPDRATVFQTWFQDEEISRSDTANLEPPEFAVDVYANPSGLALNAWIDKWEQGRPGAPFQRSSIDVGAVKGIRVTSQLLLAPSSSVFLASGAYVYRITGLGEFFDQMLASFQFLP